MFSTLSKTEIIILAAFYLSSAKALDLDQSRILSFGKELNAKKIMMSENFMQMLYWSNNAYEVTGNI